MRILRFKLTFEVFTSVNIKILFFRDGEPCGLAVYTQTKILFWRRWKQQSFSWILVTLYQTTRRYSLEYYNPKVHSIGVDCRTAYVIWKVLIFSNILHIKHSGTTLFQHHTIFVIGRSW